MKLCEKTENTIMLLQLSVLIRFDSTNTNCSSHLFPHLFFFCYTHRAHAKQRLNLSLPKTKLPANYPSSLFWVTYKQPPSMQQNYRIFFPLFTQMDIFFFEDIFWSLISQTPTFLLMGIGGLQNRPHRGKRQITRNSFGHTSPSLLHNPYWCGRRPQNSRT